MNNSHESAFGCIVLKENKEKLLKYFNETWKDIKFEALYTVDFVFDLSKQEDYNSFIDCVQRIGALNKQGFWGKGVEEPMIAIKNVPLNSIKLLSPDKKPTLKILLDNLSFIKFGSSEEEVNKLKPTGFYRKTANIIGTCSLNEWNGRTAPQIMIKELETIESKSYDF